MTSFTFKKTERLKSAKVIGRLFKEGQSFGVYPLRLVWMKVEGQYDGSPVKFTPSVAKKNFKSSVSRNRIKRKIKESWRLSKHRLYKKITDDQSSHLAFMVLYTAKEDMTYQQIDKAMRTLIHIFVKKNSRPSANPIVETKPLS